MLGYDVLLELRRGGMGEILLARRRGAHGFERLVAIKTIRPDLSGFDRVRAMFLDEARLMARLHHPAIAQVHDFAEEAGVLCLVMEYVPGVSFEQVIDRRPPPAICCQAIARVCRGLHAAHELADIDGTALGVVHRDVSPPNLMITFDGNIKILDFGIAWVRKRMAPETEFGTLKGKPPYMAPEQLRNRPLDRRTDVWAVANVMHEMLTGEPVFSGDSAYAVVHQVEFGAIPLPSARAPDVPAAVDAIVMRGLERDPARRYPTALAMASALDDAAAVLGGESLAEWAARELADERAREQAALAAAMSAARPATRPVGRASGVQTAVGNPAPVPAEPAASTELAAAPERAPVPVPEVSDEPTPMPAPARRRALGLAVAALFAVVAGGWLIKAMIDRREVGPRDLALDERPAPAVVPDAAAAPSPEVIDAALAAPAIDAAAARAAAIDAAPAAAGKAPPRRRRSDAGPRAPVAAPERPLPDAAPVAAGHGYINVGAEPFAMVKIDGVDLGNTPLWKHKLPVGPHRVELYSPDTHELRLRRTVNVQADKVHEVVAR